MDGAPTSLAGMGGPPALVIGKEEYESSQDHHAAYYPKD